MILLKSIIKDYKNLENHIRMDFFHFIFVLRRAKLCKKICIYRLSQVATMQSE